MSLPEKRKSHPRRAGEEKRAQLMAILREGAGRRKTDGHKLEYLAERTGLSVTGVRHHLKWLERNGVIRLGGHSIHVEILKDCPPKAEP